MMKGGRVAVTVITVVVVLVEGARSEEESEERNGWPLAYSTQVFG